MIMPMWTGERPYFTVACHFVITVTTPETEPVKTIAGWNKRYWPIGLDMELPLMEDSK